jgi:SP family xylose:H+ symportor-like MFS transporter
LRERVATGLLSSLPWGKSHTFGTTSILTDTTHAALQALRKRTRMLASLTGTKQARAARRDGRQCPRSHRSPAPERPGGLAFDAGSGVDLEPQVRNMSTTQASPQPAGVGIQRAFVIAVTSVAALGGLLFGYDTAVISGAIGFLQVHFALAPASTGWAASCALAGCVLGAVVAGLVSDVFGRRKVIFLSAVMFLVSAIGTSLGGSFAWFVVFRILGGLGIGAASMASPLYIAEIAPVRWRGRLVALNQFAIVAGMLLVYLVNYQIARMGTESWNQSVGWRWMFASGALPSGLLLALLFLVPETPRFLASIGRHAQARAVAERIENGSSAEIESPALAREERKEGLRAIFHPAVIRVVSIGIILAVLQQITGINVFLYYAPRIFAQLGSATDAALFQTVLVGAVNLTFTVIAVGTVDRIGRKPLLILGSAGMGICLSTMGLAGDSDMGAWQLVFVLGYIACFALSVGPVTWIILSEIFPTHIRGRAMAIATVSLWAANFFVSQTFPMMNESKYLVARFHHGFPFLIYALFCFLEAVFVWVKLPETKNRSLEEISKSWHLKATRLAAD